MTLRPISMAESLNEKLHIASHAQRHAPTAECGSAIGKCAMFMRSFDRHGGRPLPENWRSATKKHA